MTEWQNEKYMGYDQGQHLNRSRRLYIQCGSRAMAITRKNLQVSDLGEERCIGPCSANPLHLARASSSLDSSDYIGRPGDNNVTTHIYHESS